MTKFKVYRINGTGAVTIQIVESSGWYDLIPKCQYMGDPIFKIEVYSGPEPVQQS